MLSMNFTRRISVSWCLIVTLGVSFVTGNSGIFTKTPKNQSVPAIGDQVTFICATNVTGYSLSFIGVNQVDTFNNYTNNNGNLEISITLTITMTICMHCVAALGDGSDPIVSDAACAYAKDDPLISPTTSGISISLPINIPSPTDEPLNSLTTNGMPFSGPIYTPNPTDETLSPLTTNGILSSGPIYTPNLSPLTTNGIPSSGPIHTPNTDEPSSASIEVPNPTNNNNNSEHGLTLGVIMIILACVVVVGFISVGITSAIVIIVIIGVKRKCSKKGKLILSITQTCLLIDLDGKQSEMPLDKYPQKSEVVVGKEE